jgi:peptidoglycan hydrolase-like protein with peptidoglycan-binding domain
MVPASTPPAEPAPTPVAAEVRLDVRGVRGAKRFAVGSSNVYVHGTVTPFVAGQKIRVRFRRDGKPDGGRTVKIARSGGVGSFRVKAPTAKTGAESVVATHAATPQMSAVSSKTSKFEVLSPNLSVGARGPVVWDLQRRLDHLHYAVPLTGVYEAGTANAVVAYRKMTGLPPIESVGAGVFQRLESGDGRFHVRYPHDGKHVEADLSKQVLAEIEPGGKVYKLYTTSSGKPSTPTVLGRYQVYLKTPGVNSEGMVDSNYFIRGYAIHGYAEVPTYAASHGCLRVPIEDASSIYSWVQVGTIVDVYYE